MAVDLAAWTYAFSQGTQTLSTLSTQLASTPEAQQGINNIFQTGLGRSASFQEIAASENTTMSGSGLTGVELAVLRSDEFGQDTSNALSIRFPVDPSQNQNIIDYDSGYTSSPNAGSDSMALDQYSRTTPVPMIDDDGNYVTINGNTVMRPLGFSMDFIAERGHFDAPIYSDAAQRWVGLEQYGILPPNAGSLLADALAENTSTLPNLIALMGLFRDLSQTPLANFGGGKIWDTQRYQSTDIMRVFQDNASINIGIYGAAAGIPEDMMQATQNTYAYITGRQYGNAVMSPVYTSLPQINVDNVHRGYLLVNSGAIHQ